MATPTYVIIPPGVWIAVRRPKEAATLVSKYLARYLSLEDALAALAMLPRRLVEEDAAVSASFENRFALGAAFVSLQDLAAKRRDQGDQGVRWEIRINPKELRYELAESLVNVFTRLGTLWSEVAAEGVMFSPPQTVSHELVAAGLRDVARALEQTIA